MDASLENDWLHYDIWLNLMFERVGETASLRGDQPEPLAHVVPVARETHEATWSLAEENVNRNSPEAARVFEYDVQYNERKYATDGRNLLSDEQPELGVKDSSTYYKEKERYLRAPRSH